MNTDINSNLVAFWMHGRCKLFLRALSMLAHVMKMRLEYLALSECHFIALQKTESNSTIPIWPLSGQWSAHDCDEFDTLIGDLHVPTTIVQRTIWAGCAAPEGLNARPRVVTA